MIDPRANRNEKIVAEYPLPYISRKALKRVKDYMPPPVKCNCCGSTCVFLVPNEEIYGKSYGDWPYAYFCDDCGAYVGVHPNTDIPLGTMADKELREARKKAKSAWQSACKMLGLDRAKGYAWLAKQMGIEASECHFGWFDVHRCGVAYRVCSTSKRNNND